MLKFANFQTIEAKVARTGHGLMKDAHRHSFEYDPKPGFLYVRSRAISSRCNDNFDEFPADEIAAAYQTFVGKPVFVNHHNANHRRARGVIVAAVLHIDTNPDGSPDTWVEVLMEVDAINFPVLAEKIRTCTCGHIHGSDEACSTCGCQTFDGQISRTSMGCDVAYSKCSFCGNKAVSPVEYCDHIRRHKGRRIRRRTASGDGMEDVLVREICYGLRFFENSLLVEDPADPTAFFLGVESGDDLLAALAKVASYEDIKDMTPEELDAEHERMERDRLFRHRHDDKYRPFPVIVPAVATSVTAGEERKTRTPEWDAEDEQLHPRDHGKFTDSGASGPTRTPDGKQDTAPTQEQPAEAKPTTHGPTEDPAPADAPAAPSATAGDPHIYEGEDGTWTPHPDTKGTGTKEDPVVTPSIEDAAKALSLGLHVELHRAPEVATLLDRLAQMIEQAKTDGTKLNIDLCNVTVKGTNLFCTESKGIPRSLMPQLKSLPEGLDPNGRAMKEVTPNEDGEYDIQPQFLQHLKDLGYEAEEIDYPAAYLKATQNQLNAGKVAGITNALLEGVNVNKEPIFVSDDDYIVDGHHRWAGSVSADWSDGDVGDVTMPVWKIKGLDIITLLDLSNKFAADWGFKQQGVEANNAANIPGKGASKGCQGCGPTLDEMNAHAQRKMASRDPLKAMALAAAQALVMEALPSGLNDISSQRVTWRPSKTARPGGYEALIWDLPRINNDPDSYTNLNLYVSPYPTPPERGEQELSLWLRMNSAAQRWTLEAHVYKPNEGPAALWIGVPDGSAQEEFTGSLSAAQDRCERMGWGLCKRFFKGPRHASTPTLYHAASMEDRIDIERNGIDHRRGLSHWGGDRGAMRPEGNYVWTTIEDAEDYIEGHEREFDIWAIRPSGLEMAFDPMRSWNGKESYRIVAPIPPSHIYLVRTGNTMEIPEEALDRLEEWAAQPTPIAAAYGGLWQTSTGYVHRSQACPHINGENAYPIPAEDVNDEGVIEHYGHKACSTCFPAAPTKRTASTDHRFIKQGAGANLWAECSCGRWVWLGTYEGDKGRLAKARAGFDVHLWLEAQDDVYARTSDYPGPGWQTIASMAKVAYQYPDGRRLGAAELAEIALREGFLTTEQIEVIRGSNKHAYTDLEKVLRAHLYGMWARGEINIGPSSDFEGPDDTWAKAKERSKAIPMALAASMHEAVSPAEQALHDHTGIPLDVADAIIPDQPPTITYRPIGDVDVAQCFYVGMEDGCRAYMHPMVEGVTYLQSPSGSWRAKITTIHPDTKFGPGTPYADDFFAAASLTRLARGPLDTPITTYGLRYDPQVASQPLVDQAASWDGWDRLPVSQVPVRDLWATEAVVASSSINKVVHGNEPFREGYSAYVLIDHEGRALIIDGNHRAAMYAAMGRATMPAHVASAAQIAPRALSGASAVTSTSANEVQRKSSGSPAVGPIAGLSTTGIEHQPPIKGTVGQEEVLNAMSPAMREQFARLIESETRAKGFGQGGKWYHASPQHFAPGTILKPGHAPTTPGLYEHLQHADQSVGFEGRGSVVWITPDRDDASFWAAVVGGENIYEVEPVNPRPFGFSGADGYVCDSARVLTQVSKTGAKTAADIYDKRRLKGDLFAFEQRGFWLIGEATKATGGVVKTIRPFGTTLALPAEGLELFAIPRHVIVDREGLERAYPTKGFASKQEAAHYAWGFTMANGPLTEHMEQSGQWTEPRPPWFRSDKEHEDHMRRTRDMVGRTMDRTSASKEACRIDPFSSRACERGIHSCVVHHQAGVLEWTGDAAIDRSLWWQDGPDGEPHIQIVLDHNQGAWWYEISRVENDLTSRTVADGGPFPTVDEAERVARNKARSYSTSDRPMPVAAALMVRTPQSGA